MLSFISCLKYMKQPRDLQGRFKKQYRTASRWEMLIVLSIVVGVLLAITVDATRHEVVAQEVIEEVVEEPKEVRVEVVIDWTEERIKEEVWKAAAKYNTYPDKMWEVIKCESGLDIDVQSRHILSYGREQSYGLAQFHIPAGNKTADGRVITKEIALDPVEALDAMAYHFSIGNARLWTCYRNLYM